MFSLSKFHFHSAGIVAANKPLTTKIIEVVPIEEYPMFDGELSDNKSEYKTGSKDDKGSSYELQLDTTPSISARWLPFGASNRLTAPDVRRGEMVMIYRFGDTDKYYWQTLKDDNKLRKLETVIYGWSATTNEDDDIGPDKMYYAEVSTHEKIIHLHTSKANGEPFSYDIQINAGKGFIKIQDDIGQLIVLDSNKHQIILQNTDTSKVEVIKREIFIDAPDLVEIRARKIAMYSQEHLTQSNKITRNSKEEIMSTSKNKIHVPLTKHYGNYLVDGTLFVKRGIKG
jgi:hypothetical protein